MSQHDYDIANADGSTVRADLNSLFEAIATLNSGSTAPSMTFAFMSWFDTANNLLKRRNAANTDWVTIASLAVGVWIPYRDGSAVPDWGTSVGNLVQLEGIGSPAVAGLPEVDGSQLTGITTGLTLGTPDDSTGGTSKEFTGIPSGTKRIVITLAGTSLSGTSGLNTQIGDDGGFETSDYFGAGSFVTGASTGSTNSSTGFLIPQTSAATVIYGTVTLTLLSASTNTWTASGVLGRSDAAGNFVVGGVKTLSAELDRVRVISANGTDTFDGGTVNIAYM